VVAWERSIGTWFCFGSCVPNMFVKMPMRMLLLHSWTFIESFPLYNLVMEPKLVKWF